MFTFFNSLDDDLIDFVLEQHSDSIVDYFMYKLKNENVKDKENKMNKFESGCYYKRTKNTKASQENIAYYKCVYTNNTQALLEFYNEDDKLVTTGLVPLEAEYFEKIEKPIKKVKVGQVYTDEYGSYRYILSINGALATYLYTTSKGNQCVNATKCYNDAYVFGQYVETLNNSQEFVDKYVF